MKENEALSPVDQRKIRDILDRYIESKGILIPILQEVQEIFGYLSRPILEFIAKELKVSFSSVYGVATFYSQFHLKPRGEHIVKVCLGTACHVRGADDLLKTLKSELGVEPGQTTTDLKFTLEEVACIGACGLAPAMMVDDQTFGRLTKEKVLKIIADFQGTSCGAKEE